MELQIRKPAVIFGARVAHYVKNVLECTDLLYDKRSDLRPDWPLGLCHHTCRFASLFGVTDALGLRLAGADTLITPRSFAGGGLCCRSRFRHPVPGL